MMPTSPRSSVVVFDVALQVAAYQNATAEWHLHEEPMAAQNDLALQLHRANYDLWHLEDRARDPRATDAEIATVKRNIDRVNQHRNDLVEQFDIALLHRLAEYGLPFADVPLHSETPGMMLDRLSILALKRFHTAEQAVRPDATVAHREHNTERLAILQQQSDDLAACLTQLLNDVTQGRRGYRLYKQLKMYNDPDLNPVLYNARATQGTAAKA